MKVHIFKSKIFVLVVLIFTALLVMTAFLFLRINRHFSQSIILSSHQDHLYMVKAVAAGMQKVIDHLSGEIAHLSTLPAIRAEEVEEYAGLFQDFYRIFRGRLNSIYKIDQNRQVQYVYPLINEQIGRDMADVQCVKMIFRNKEPVISKCFISESGAYVLAINYPIFRGEREKDVIGALRCIIHVDALTRSFFSLFDRQAKGSIWIIDQEGTVIYHSDPEYILKDYKHLRESANGYENKEYPSGENSPLQAIEGGIEDWGIDTFWGKERELYAFTPLLIGTKKWLIGITVPYADLYAPIRNNNRNMFFLTLVLFSIFALGGYILHYANKRRSLLETETEFLKQKLVLEEEIKKERDRLHKLFGSMADAVLVINADFEVEFMNRSAEFRFGDQIGKRCFQVLCGCDRPCSSCILSASENFFSGQTLIQCRDTVRNKWYEISAAPLEINNQEKSIVEIIRDVTSEKELEQKVIASEKKYRTLVNHTNDLIMMQDFHGRVIFVSESIENLLGYQVEEFCHKPFQQFLTENPINDFWRKEIKSQSDLQKRLKPHFLECSTKDGERIILEANESPVFDRQGQERQIMGVYRDITERKRLEEQLLESERLRMLSLTKRFRYGEIIGKNAKMQEIYELIEAVSQSKATVLIQGRSGTGKELVARAIHYQGPLAKGPFIGLSCSVLSESLLESELFGHVKGAFTGAVKDKPGRFELADGGTLFLDEIGEMSPNLQAKLLRVLQEREFERVGGERTIKVEVRVIAATNRDLKEEVAKGRFREDLYYRLNVVEIRLPTVRERMDDLPLLAAHFIEKFNRETGKNIRGLSREAMKIFTHYSWPGNVREIEHVIEHAFVKCTKNNTIRAIHLPEDIVEAKTEEIIQTGIRRGLPKEQIEKDILLNTLEECDWNLVLVMQKLNISRPTLWRRMKKYGLQK